MTDHDILLAALRHDFPSFIAATVRECDPGADYKPNWHIEAIAHHLELCISGQIKRLIITVPPRHLKSLCASVAFPAFLLGHDPTLRIICASYGDTLVTKHMRDCRKVMESPWYRKIFTTTRIDRRKNTEIEFETTAGGGRYGATPGGALTGRGGRFIIIDDPIKPGDAMSELRRQAVNQWYDKTLYSRLDNKRDDVIIIVMQRLHEDDLVGHLLARDDDWTVLDLPAIAPEEAFIPIDHGLVHHRRVGELLHPEREPQYVLDQMRATLGTAAFNAQYLQRPVAADGQLIKREWFRSYTSPPAFYPGEIIQSWDTASKAGELNDYSVCTTWLKKDDHYFLLDVFRARLEYPDLKRKAIELAQQWRAKRVLIEDAGSGIQLVQDLRHEKMGINPIARRPEKDKITRLSSQSAVIEAGRVHLPQTAPWLDDFLNELMAFPLGRHDDQADSVSQFLQFMFERQYQRVTSGRVVGLI